MNWYVDVLKKYAVFTGRARREEYWYFFLFNLVFAFAWGFVVGLVFNRSGYGTSQGIAQLYSLAVLLPSIGVGIRRLHDVDKSGWWLLLALVPFAGLYVLYLLIQPGTPGPNRYGPDPKAGEAGSMTPAAAQAVAPAGWMPDPTGRHQYRYWDGAVWTSHVSDDGVAAVDPV